VAALAAGLAFPGALVLSRAAGRVVATGGPSRRAGRSVTGSPRAAAAVPGMAPDPMTICVLVPARDEKAVLPGLLGDLGRQELWTTSGPLRLRVVVIDDRSVDGTATAAEAAMRTACLDGCVIRRDGPGGGKGDALRHVPAGALTDARLIVVLDADARVAPDFLRRVAGHGAAGDAAFTARRRIMGGERGGLARIQDDEQALDAWILAGRIGLGGAAELRGNGMAVTPEALEAAGGWPTGVLTEDLEVSTALLAAGISVAWAGDVLVEETAAPTLSALARQRLRWSEGSTRRLLAQLPRAMAGRAPLAARLDVAIYASQLGVPSLILGSAIRALGRGWPGPVAALAGAYVGTGTMLAWQAIGRLQGANTGHRAARAVAVGVFSAQWLAGVPIGLARIALGPATVTFVPTRHRPTHPGVVAAFADVTRTVIADVRINVSQPDLGDVMVVSHPVSVCDPVTRRGLAAFGGGLDDHGVEAGPSAH
jgi:1,2-diacylglycerol 3-beta-glucosyltransferase